MDLAELGLCQKAKCRTWAAWSMGQGEEVQTCPAIDGFQIRTAWGGARKIRAETGLHGAWSMGYGRMGLTRIIGSPERAKHNSPGLGGVADVS